MRLARLAGPLLPLALVACGGDTETAPGGLSADEARELNEAAAMLDANAMNANAMLNEAR